MGFCSVILKFHSGLKILSCVCRIRGFTGGGKEAMAAGSGLVRGFGRLLISRQAPLTQCQDGPKFSTCWVRRSDEVSTSAADSSAAARISESDGDSSLGVEKLTKKEALQAFKAS